MNKYLITCVVWFFLIPMSLIGCTGVKSGSHQDFRLLASQQPADEIKKDYTFHTGDIIAIKFFYNPELNEEVIIRPDGKISLQLIDEVVTAGLTPSELDGLLTEKYSKILKNSEIAVIVKEFAGQKVYVGGEVNLPGMIPVTGSLTSLQAILQAGGFKDTAELKNIVILRNQGTGEPLFMTINLKENLTMHTQLSDILLKPYDVVFVPKTTIAKMNQFVDQYIKKLIPISMNLGFSYIYNLNPEVVTK